jgi:uncharacterized protein YhbP (UPF0306 family)
MSGETAARIMAFLDAHHVMSLATVGAQGPHAANLFYARDGFTLLWVSDPRTRHSLELGADPRVAATVAPDYQDFAEIRGVQISGEAHRLRSTLQSDRARALLEARYPFLQRLSSRTDIQQAYESAEFYRLLPRRLVLIDNRRGFGHKETLALDLSVSEPPSVKSAQC